MRKQTVITTITTICYNWKNKNNSSYMDSNRVSKLEEAVLANITNVETSFQVLI